MGSVAMNQWLARKLLAMGDKDLFRAINSWRGIDPIVHVHDRNTPWVDQKNYTMNRSDYVRGLPPELREIEELWIQPDNFEALLKDLNVTVGYGPDHLIDGWCFDYVLKCGGGGGRNHFAFREGCSVVGPWLKAVRWALGAYLGESGR